MAVESRGEGALLDEVGGKSADPLPSTDGVGVGADEGFFGVPLLGSELKGFTVEKCYSGKEVERQRKTDKHKV